MSFEKEYEKIFNKYKEIIKEDFLEFNKDSILLHLHLYVQSIISAVATVSEKRKGRLIRLLNIALFAVSLIFQIPVFQVGRIRISLTDSAWNAHKIKGGKWFKVVEDYVLKISKILGEEYENALKDLLVKLAVDKNLGEHLVVKSILEKRLQKGELKLSDLPKDFIEIFKSVDKSVHSIASMMGPKDFELYKEVCLYIYDKYEKSLEIEIFRKKFGPKKLIDRVRCLALAWVGPNSEEKLWKPLDDLFSGKNEKKRRAWKLTKKFIKEVAFTVLKLTEREIVWKLKYDKEFPIGLYEWILHPAVVATILSLLYHEHRFKGKLEDIEVSYEVNGKLMDTQEYIQYLKRKFNVQDIGEILPKVLHKLHPEILIIIYVMGRYYECLYG